MSRRIDDCCASRSGDGSSGVRRPHATDIATRVAASRNGRNISQSLAALRIEDCGLRIDGSGVADCGLARRNQQSQISNPSIRNPQSSLRSSDSFGSERDHRIDAGRPARRQVGRDQRDQRSAPRRRRRRSRIVRAGIEQQLRRPATASAGRPRWCRGRRRPSAITIASRTTRPSTVRSVGAERHADADLARALRHRVREHAEDADRRQRQRHRRRTARAASCRSAAGRSNWRRAARACGCCRPGGCRRPSTPRGATGSATVSGGTAVSSTTLIALHRPLPVRQIDLRRIRFVEPGVLDVADDADDFSTGLRGLPAASPAERDPLADRILVREVLPRRRLGDQHHRRRAGRDRRR